MTISTIEILKYKYPNQIELRNIIFKQPLNSEDILISYWNVPNELEPTQQEINEYGIAHERAIEINVVSVDAALQSQLIIDATARAKSYADGVACASYATSSNVQWKNESIVFIDWRDSVWNYLYALLSEISGGSDPIPSIQQILNGIPPIVWPN